MNKQSKTCLRPCGW